MMRSQGLPGVTLLDNRTPEDVKVYYKDVLNAFNSIFSKMSIVEAYHVVGDAEARWQEARKSKR
eukprot:8731873-Alexandrium_andersonii.AAC.1